MPLRLSLVLLVMAARLTLTTWAVAIAAERHYEVVRDWPALPANHVLGQCVGVGVDSRSNVFVFHHSGREWTTPFPKEPIARPTVSLIAGQTGKLLAAWGAGLFIMPHGLTVDVQDNVWVTDVGLHQVLKFTPAGKLLLTLGERGVPGSDRTHFNRPTDVAVLPDGSCYVSDGYENSRVVKFNAEGQYEFAWGNAGSALGEFDLPHGIAVDRRGRVFVCDRSNDRLQIFDPRGHFLAAWKGPQIGRPYGVSVGPEGQVFVIDGGEHDEDDGPAGKPGRSSFMELDAEGRLLGRGGSFGTKPGQFEVGHDLAAARDGSVYVADAQSQRVQKFVRRNQLTQP